MAPLRAETIGGALVKAYLNNPDINQQRAATRASDENVPKASSGFLPQASATANDSFQQTNLVAPIQSGGNSDTTSHPRGADLTITQNVFNGNRTINSVRQAESGVLAQRETLRNTEQNVLQDAVTYYMNVLRDSAILSLDRNNVDVLKEQLRQTQDRFTVGEVTRTDVAQAQASLAGAQATAIQAESTLQTSIANYHETIGDDPKSLAPVKPLDRVLPKGLPEAIAISQVEHPAIVASLHGVDSAELNVKIVEGALYPSINLQAQVGQNYDVSGLAPPNHSFSVSLVGQISVPIYDGGLTYASTRQAKEQLGQQELATDLQRDKVRAAVVSAWSRPPRSRSRAFARKRKSASARRSTC
jgi:outer membrane protein